MERAASVRISALHVIPGLHRKDGGPSQSVVRLTDSLADDPTLSITLISHCDSRFESIPSSNGRVRRASRDSSSSLALSSGLVDRRILRDALQKAQADLIHTHCLWHLANHWAMRLAREVRIPLICQPRGMLEPWALNYKSWKKRVALLLFQRNDLDAVSAFIATSALEAESIRRFGLRQPIAIIPNGIDLPAAPPVARERDERRERVILFLSRLHPVKGASVLVRAWSQCRVPGWRLVLAGPDAGGHLKEVMAEVTRLQMEQHVSYVGELHGQAKSDAFRTADVFVLPSFGENFGMVVGEALSFGVPVITTKCTPWGVLESAQCGWWIDTGVEPLVTALRQATALSDEDRAEMGRRGIECSHQYQWQNAARETAALYHWILGKGEKPAAVMTVGKYT